MIEVDIEMRISVLQACRWWSSKSAFRLRFTNGRKNFSSLIFLVIWLINEFLGSMMWQICSSIWSAYCKMVCSMHYFILDNYWHCSQLHDSIIGANILPFNIFAINLSGNLIKCKHIPLCSSQWTLEHTIRNLGKEIKQHSNLFANLSQCGIRWAWVNALKAMIFELDTERSEGVYLPHGSKDLSNGFVLLWAWELDPYPLHDCEANSDALCEYLGILSLGLEVLVRCWAKLCIPTGQNCYSTWKEKQKPLEKQ